MDKQEATDVLIAALRLARQRVTGEDLAAKTARSQQLGNAIEQVKAGPPTVQPTAAALRELLEDPDDSRVRQALAAWDS